MSNSTLFMPRKLRVNVLTITERGVPSRSPARRTPTPPVSSPSARARSPAGVRALNFTGNIILDMTGNVTARGNVDRPCFYLRSGRDRARRSCDPQDSCKSSDCAGSGSVDGV